MSCFIIDKKEYVKAVYLFQLLNIEKDMKYNNVNIKKNMEILMEINYKAYNYRYGENEICPLFEQLHPSLMHEMESKFENDYKHKKALICAKLFRFIRCISYQCNEGEYYNEALQYIHYFCEILLSYITENANDWGEIKL